MSHNTLLHRLIRPAVRSLVTTPVTPNQLTTMRLASGLVAAVAFAQGGRLWPLVGAASMLASLMLDRADGELARATGKMSRGGYRYDLFADAVSTITVFVGMGIGARSTWGSASLLFGVVAAVSVLALFLLMPRVEPKRETPPSRPFDPDDALLIAPFLIWAGLMPWTVLTAAVLSPIAVAALTPIALRRSTMMREGEA